MKIALSTLTFAVLAATVNAQGTFNPAAFPPVNAVPPVTSPEVVGWLKDLNFADVPNFPPHTGNPPACPAISTIPADQCWWTCQTCPGTDIESCPTPGTWGITFDDGPTPQTVPLLKMLKDANVKATFFVMGSNVVRNAEVLKQEVAEGHHIASHTWSHHALTTLTNQQIVAELKWTEKAVFDITGLHMKYVRPPYGDIDNRVRGVIKKLGYTVVDWTSDAYDSKDFSLNKPDGTYDEAQLTQKVTQMTTNLVNYSKAPGAKGIITLQHDLYPVTIEFAKRLLPVVAQTQLKATTVANCLNDANGYQNEVKTPTPSGGSNSTTAGAKPTSGPSVLPSSANALLSGGLMMTLAAVAGTALAYL